MEKIEVLLWEFVKNKENKIQRHVKNTKKQKKTEKLADKQTEKKKQC